MSSALIDLQYLPNVHWFSQLVKYDSIYIEREENFVKSTFRNRCEIAGANGRQTLSIPLHGGRDHHQKYRDTKIAYQNNWQDNHWHSIQSAYGSTPFFEYYAAKLEPFYQKQYAFLFDFNLELFQTILPLIKLKKDIAFTDVYEKAPEGKVNLRSSRKSNKVPAYPRYYQVFEEKNGFQSNLSIIDTLFHLGPQTLIYLSQSVESP